MGALKPWHIAIFVAALVLLFGAKRLPDAARSLGRSLRIIKAETKGLIDDNNDLAEKAEPQQGWQPLNGEIQQPGQYQQPPQGYQQPPQAYQQPPQNFQQQPQGYQQPQPQPQPYTDPVQRSNDH